LLAGVLAFAVGCGPANAFCPNVAADAGGVCPIFGDDGMAPQVDMPGVMNCPPGYQQETNPDGNSGLICVKVN
jgi:hypothetical protein